MVVPALIYVAFTLGNPDELTGWGTPMATDIAFALAVLAIMGRGLPLALRAFLLTMAVVDDLGAIAVIAMFYSNKFSLPYFMAAVALVVVWFLLQKFRVRGTAANLLLYLPLFLLTWYITHESGVHATVAGVALGLVTRVSRDPGEDMAPGERAEFHLRPFVSGVAVPLFAFASAGVRLSGNTGGGGFGEALTSPVTLGVLLGLVAGKPIGVVGGAWLMARFTRATLSSTLRWADIVAVGFLGGIGFTVSLLIAELAFEERADLLTDAKLGILTATLAAALLASIALASRRRALSDLIEEEERDLDLDGIPDVYQAAPDVRPEPPEPR
jgi:NhaA family Na+:H+ antiporter